MFAEKQAELMQVASMFGEQALRVVAIAYGDSLQNLTFLGLVGIDDPPKVRSSQRRGLRFSTARLFPSRKAHFKRRRECRRRSGRPARAALK
jgi:hypothetical protein